MKCHLLKTILILGILTGMPSIAYTRSAADSLLLERIFNYRRNFTPGDIQGHTSTIYVKRNFNVWRRDVTLWAIPSMYSIAEGDRTYLSESYQRVWFKDFNDYDSRRQATFSTIRHNRHTMPITQEFTIPNIYGTCLYGNDHILSPFSRRNRHYYRYRVRQDGGETAVVYFKPRFLRNTQLVAGEATIHVATGRVMTTSIDGEYDMMRFHTETEQGEGGRESLLPKKCKTHLVFKFMGNQVYFNHEAVYDCPPLPDSLQNVFDAALMDSIRPTPLNDQEQRIFDHWVETHQPDTTAKADTTHHFNFAKDILQDAIGDNLISSLGFETGRARMKMSPIIDPSYISYSSNHGFAYKLKLSSHYKFDNKHMLEFHPWCGYNFKYKKFYFTIPLYFNYLPERNGQMTVIYGNGNRIGSSTITDEIRREFGDTVTLNDMTTDLFDDNYLTISNNYMLTEGLDLTLGFTYHRREAYNPDELKRFGKPKTYKSFAPMVTLRVKPWRKGPLLSVDYERGLTGVLGSSIDYERWEFDGSLKYAMKPLRKFNARLGYGFYTRKRNNYFVDYMHFRDNKLPGGWDDEWSGDFQLLDSRWYNESSYYARAHCSYESPFLVGTWLPLFGRIIEKECFYVSALSIDKTRLYSELGYGFSTRFVSIGLFTSFVGSEFQHFDCKFTFELFRRW